ncbi:WD40 repeat-like protein [Obba rivulosa]|uniref:WD40 repeat-like protein n=1 Tax=Obba rivulosa TaxID=1052685 RepID=A0A8E2DLB9_9APHY|nr:WD40 repeat-like protein [Obba rivulosa]
MAAITPPTAQVATQGVQQANIAIAVKAIEVKLKLQVLRGAKAFILRRKSTISCTIGGDAQAESFDTKNYGTFRWTLATSREVPSAALLKICWREEGSSKSPIEITLHYDDIMKQVNKVIDGPLKHEYVCEHDRATVTVTFTLKKAALHPEDMINAVRIAERRRGILDGLGKSNDVLRTVLDIGRALGELNPVAKAVFSCLDIIYKKVEAHDNDNDDVLSLAVDVSDMIQSICDVEQFATIAQFEMVIAEMEILMQDVRDLVVERDSQELSSVLLSGDRGKIGDLKARLSRFKRKFDRRINVQTIVTVENIKTGLEKLVSAQEDNRYLDKLDPGYNKTDPPRCLYGTREAILSEITDWTNNFKASNVLWIHGYPGAGKSTIAFTIAKRLEEAHRLGAIFAFDRKSGTSPSVFWRHISYKLAQEYPSCRDDIVSRLKVGSLHNKTADEIFRQLVAEPLRQWARSNVNIPRDRLPVIVVDALDECGGLGGSSTQGRKETLSHIDEWAKLHPHFKLIVTSRFEHDIGHSFSTIPHQSLSIDTGNAVTPESTGDIQRYIEDRFRNITRGRSNLPKDWPGADVVDELATHASGIFIWAATALNYVEIKPGKERLKEVRGGSLPPGNVHALYRQILEAAFSGWKRRERADAARVAGAIVIAQVILTSADLARLLEMDAADVGAICEGLRPVLGGGDTLRFAHQSFVDFLLGHKNQSDRGSVEVEHSCPEEFRIEPSIAHHHLTDSIFHLMNKSLRFNLCNIESSFQRNETLPRHHADNIDPSVSYACRFWGFHLQNSSQETVPESSRISEFMNEKLLFWLEALSLLGVLNTAVPALTCLGRRLEANVSEMSPATERIVMVAKDAIKLVRYFAPATRKSAPHVYVSALPLAPRSSIVANMYRSRFRNTMTVQIGQLAHWPAEETIIHGHEDSVWSVAFSPDGHRIASGSSDNTIRMWDAQTGEPVTAPFNGHEGSVNCVAFSPDGQRIASGSSDNTIRMWDAQTGEPVTAPFNGHQGWVLSVAFSPNGQRIASGSSDQMIRMWDAQTGEPVIAPFNGHQGLVWSVAFSPDGHRIASGSSDNTIRMWDAQTGELLAAPFNGHESSVLSVAFSPNGHRIASGSGDKTIRMWDTQTGEPVAAPFNGHENSVWSVAFSPDGQRIASGSLDNTIRIWDAQTGQPVAAPFKGHEGSVSSVAFSPDGQQIASGSSDKMVRMWDAQTGEPVTAPFNGHEEWVNCVAFSPDGQRIASGSSDKMIRMWDAQTGESGTAPFNGHENSVNCVAFSPDGQRVASGSEDKTIRMWNAQTGEPVTAPFKGHQGPVLSIAFSPDGQRIASGSWDKTIRMWDAQTGEPVTAPFKEHQGPVLSVAFSPDGQRIASGSEDKTIRMWDAQTGEPVTTPFNGHENSVWSVTFSPDGQRVASGSSDKTIRMWNARTGQPVTAPFKGHEGLVWSIAFSPDGQRIASGSYDRTVRMWNAQTGEPVTAPFNGHEGSVLSVAFSPDGQRIASGSSDKTIRIWKLDGDRQLSFTDHSILREDGWALDESHRPLFWVPRLHRLSLHRPSNVVVIGPYETRLDLSRAAFGTDWTRCYTPSSVT